MKLANEFLNETNPQVVMTMENGKQVKIELFPKTAPITVKNFLELVDNKFYDGLIFHRVIKDFMIQGGDPTGTGCGGSAENIKGEFQSNRVDNELSHTRGVISMARSMMPNSASSQFFIMHKDGTFLDGDYAAFGVVVNGIEVVDEIATTKTGRQDRPVEDQKIKTIERVR